MYSKISDKISAHELSKYLKVIYAIDEFDIRIASFFSNHIHNLELKEDLQILLLLLLSTLRRGLSKAFKEDLIFSLNNNIDDEELYSLLLKENVDTNYITKFLSKNIINIKGDIDKWLDFFFENKVYQAMKPIVGDSINPTSFFQPLIICDIEKRIFWFQAYYIAEKYLEKMGNYLFIDDSIKIDEKKIADILKEVIEKEFIDRMPDIRQLAAIILSLLKRVIVISGGPGTGKSSVVSLILKVLIKYESIPIEKIALCAPTGRAKSRLLETIKSSNDNNFSNLSAYTIHSLLGLAPNAISHQILSNNKKLPYKLIVVDEVSMVDIRLFYNLIEKLSPDCKLILIGDTEQLPPIDAGAVLGNLSLIKGNTFSSLSLDAIEKIKRILEFCNFNFDLEELSLMATDIKSKLVDHIIFLTKNYRSDKQILDWWTNFIYSGNIPSTTNYSAISYISGANIKGGRENSRKHFESLLTKWVTNWYKKFYSWKNEFSQKIFTNDNNEAVEEFSKLIRSMMVLCCKNEGLFGRIYINEFCKNIFWTLKGKKGLVPSFDDGLPVIITRNQYNIDLYNGDIGLTIEYNKKLYLCFLSGKKIIYLPIHSINSIDVAFAITVHKSQGSEFDEILFVIPEKLVFNLSKEIVYTAITRTRQKVTILDYGNIFEDIKNLKKEQRYSVLGELWG